MKKEIHPKYFPEAKVTCACGNSWTTGSTKEEIRTEVCSSCHPFFTGKQNFVDTAGRIEKFMKKFSKGTTEKAAPKKAVEKTEKAD